MKQTAISTINGTTLRFFLDRSRPEQKSLRARLSAKTKFVTKLRSVLHDPPILVSTVLPTYWNHF